MKSKPVSGTIRPPGRKPPAGSYRWATTRNGQTTPRETARKQHVPSAPLRSNSSMSPARSTYHPYRSGSRSGWQDTVYGPTVIEDMSRPVQGRPGGYHDPARDGAGPPAPRGYH